jgi:uncharacterized membrane protein
MRCALLALVSCGCSWIGVRAPGQEMPRDCTDSTALPTADTVGAVVFDLVGADGLVALGGALGSSRGDTGLAALAGLVVGVSGAIIGTLYTASAVHGYHAVARCREAKAAHD